MAENLNCETTFATLRVFAKDLEPERITALLGVAPTQSRSPNPAAGLRLRSGLWTRSTEELDLGTCLEDHINALLDLVDRRDTQLAVYLADLTDVGFDVFCFWSSRTGHGGPDFSNLLLTRLAALGLSISFDLYLDTEDEE